MIEFKAECGHTVRARDEDAGKVVRCSYCGREAQAPDKNAASDDLEYLFSEVEKTGVYESPGEHERVRRMRNKTGTAVVMPKGRGDRFNPFAIVLKLCYVCVVLVVLIVLGKYSYRYLYSGDARTTQRTTQVRPPRDGAGAGVARPSAAPTGVGLLSPPLDPNRCGIFVSSVPAGAEAYIARSGVIRDSIYRSRSEDIAGTLRTGQLSEALTPGQEYDVFVALQISDPSLMKLPGYSDCRRAHGKSGNDDLFEEYFLPDGAVDLVTETAPSGSMMIIRKYQCQVFEKTWSPVFALFLPRLSPKLPLLQLLAYVSQPQTFGFDDAAVKAELSFQGIDGPNQTYMVDMLRRVGIAPYWEDGAGKYRFFYISLTNGSVNPWPGSFRMATR